MFNKKIFIQVMSNVSRLFKLLMCVKTKLA